MTNIQNKPPSKKRKRGNPNWVGGVSGNPGGRPKLPHEFVEACQSHTLEAVAVLVKWMLQEDHPAVAVASAKEILNRAWGTAPETVKITGEDGGPVRVAHVIEPDRIKNIIEILSGAGIVGDNGNGVNRLGEHGNGNGLD